MTTEIEKDRIIEEYKKLLKLKDLKIDEMEENQKIKNENTVPLSVILNLPKFDFIRFNKSESESKKGIVTPHKSKRGKINIKKRFEIIPENIEKLQLNMKKINFKNSTFFGTSSYLDDKTIRYSSENTIQRLAYNYMTDIFEILELTKYINFYDTPSMVTAISEKELKKMNYPDVIIIKTRKNKPIIAMEIKKPYINKKGVNILDDDNVIGQIYDYMLSIKSFYNQKNVYGILTSLSGWKILSLPEEEEIDFNSRIIYESKIYDFSDPDLPKVLIGIIKKSIDSTYYSIKIFDEKRNYIEYSKEECRWKRMNQTELQFLENNINFDIYKDCKKLTYTIYKFFQTGRTNQTSLIINNCGSIGVLKQFFGTQYNKNKEKTEEFIDFEREASMWKHMYEIDAEIQKINGKPTFLTPLIFTLEKRYNTDYKHYEVFIQTDLTKIFTYEGANASDLPIKMSGFQSDIDNLAKKINIKKSARHAIKYIAKKNYIHNDLKWEHIGLYPVLVNGVVDRLEPILIDLESLEEKKKKEAKKEMKQQLEIMSENCVFIKNTGYVTVN
uniref:Uncharacterized protein n=1 Tax=viral metagenome TaxID=1070528 RepID=A0A6C0ADY9_9ZZZZ